MLTTFAAAVLAASLLPSTSVLAPGEYAPASHRLELRLPVGNPAWFVGGLLGGAATFAVAGAELEAAAGRKFTGIGLFTGLAVGLAAGAVVGYLAKHRWVSARYATLALMVLGVGALATETGRAVDALSSGRVRISFGGLLPM